MEAKSTILCESKERYYRPRVNIGTEAIGNTPLVPLTRVVEGLKCKILAKLEYFNPTGSYKDRMALSMIEEAEKRGEISPEKTTIVEYTGGSAGSALAFVCAVKGYKLKVVTSDAFSQEKIRMMRLMGAEVDIVPSRGGLVTPDLMPRMIERTRELSQHPNVYWTDQCNNKDNPIGHQAMGKEILEQTDYSVDAFITSVGTAGCAMGVSKVLKGYNPKIGVYVVEPSTSAVISGGEAGEHGIEGIALGFVPPLLKKDLYDGTIVVEEEEAREMAYQLSLKEGIFCGTSSGANVVAAIKFAKEHGGDITIVTTIVDSGFKYISTNLFPQ